MSWVAWVVLALASLPMAESGAAFARALDRSASEFGDSVRAALDVRAARARVIENSTELAERFDLPLTRARVGAEPIDVVSVHQSVLLANGFDYRPRPVFQSYAAYSPELVLLNARFYESERAPRFVLLRLMPLFDYLPAMEDAAVLEILLCDYEPVLGERGFLLLERARRTPTVRAVTDAMEREIGFGEALAIPSSDAVCRRFALDVRISWIGRLRALVFQAPPLQLELTTASGATRTYRILPELMRRGILLDPLIAEPSDLVRWFSGATLERVTSLRVLAPDGNAALFQSRILARVEPAPDLPRPESRPRRRELEDAALSVFADEDE